MVKKKAKAKAKAKANLPGDIIEANILTRLPVETLIRFTAVCKSWHSLLSHPYFINQFHIHNNKITHLLLTHDVHQNHIVATDQSFFSYNALYFSRNSLTGVAYCHGIVCVLTTSANSTSQQQQLSLWNPALRTKKIVDICDQQYVMSIGFGYHRQTNDYKVVKLVHDFCTIKYAEIYSLTSDSWTKIDKLGAGRYLVLDSFGVYLSLSCGGGAYCWFGYIRDSDVQEGIISFDMQDEAFKVMVLPYTRTTDAQTTVFIYQDSLAVLYTHPNHSSNMCYIWVMKVYNNPESWTMLCKFDTQLPCSFVGVTQTERIVLSCCLYRGNMMSKEAIEIDIGKSRKTTVSFPTHPIFISSFTQSLALLKEVHSKKSPSN